MQRMRMDDIGLAPRGHAGDMAPGNLAEPLFIRVQHRDAETAEAAPALRPVDQIPHIRRLDDRRAAARRVADGVSHVAEERPASDDFDVHAHRGQLTHPRHVPRLAAAPHHAQTPQEHHYPHAAIRITYEATEAQRTRRILFLKKRLSVRSVPPWLRTSMRIRCVTFEDGHPVLARPELEADER